MPMNMAYKALTSDVIMMYTFGKSTNFVTREDYNRASFEALAKGGEFVHWMLHIGWLGWLMESLPIAIVKRLAPVLGSIIQLQKVNLDTQTLIFKSS